MLKLRIRFLRKVKHFFYKKICQKNKDISCFIFENKCFKNSFFTFKSLQIYKRRVRFENPAFSLNINCAYRKLPLKIPGDMLSF
jgi:hypothetical protein